MVHEQGEMIDSIEANVESAQMRVEEGTSQLASAASYQVIQKLCCTTKKMLTSIQFQSKLRRRKCIIGIIASVILLIIIAIIIWQSR